MSSSSSINLLSFTGKVKVLHLTWFAFFLTFVVWFNHAPLMAAIRDTLGLSNEQVTAILMINVALTIPARIIIGMLVDHFGPRLVYTWLLIISSVVCMFFAMANSFQQLLLSRFLLGFVGAGFVIGIRLIGEWFPSRQVGLAEGIYGGWGNFGSAAAAMALPGLALLYGGDNGWRYAIGTTAIMLFLYAFIYYRSVRDTPEGATYFKPNKRGGLEVTSVGDFWFCLLMHIPLFAALAILTSRLGALDVIPDFAALIIYGLLFLLFAYQGMHLYRANKDIFSNPVPQIQRYRFKQVAILNLCYLVTFGSELAVVSMLPLFFLDTFQLTPVMAGMLASGFAFMNLVSRPTGGWFSDRFGRRLTLIITLTALAVGYFTMALIDSTWSIAIAVAVTMACSFFVQAGEGAVFAMVPLVRRRLTGQIAGMVGAYGNVGGILFLAVLSVASPAIFFTVIAAAALLGIAAVLFLDEPDAEAVEVLPDGTVQVIELH